MKGKMKIVVAYGSWVTPSYLRSVKRIAKELYDQRGHAYDEYMANELAKYSFEDWELPEKNVRELLEKGVTWIDH